MLFRSRLHQVMLRGFCHPSRDFVISSSTTSQRSTLRNRATATDAPSASTNGGSKTELTKPSRRRLSQLQSDAAQAIHPLHQDATKFSRSALTIPTTTSTTSAPTARLEPNSARNRATTVAACSQPYRTSRRKVSVTLMRCMHAHTR